MLICLATSERPPISDFLFRVGRELESVGPAKLFDRFGGIFPGKTWGKHLLQRPPTGARFRQLRLFPYHLKSAGSDTVPVRVRSAAPLAGRFFKSLPVFYVYLSLNQRSLQLRLPRPALTHCPGVRRYLLSWNHCCAPTTPGFVSWRFRLQAEAKRSYVGDRETECDEDYFCRTRFSHTVSILY